MPFDEVEIKYDDEDDENILINKKKEEIKEMMRREHEIKELEKIMEKFMDITLENQKIITNVVRSNESLREDLAVLIGKVDRLFDKFEDFVNVVKEAAEEDNEEHLAQQIVKKSIEPIANTISELSKSIQESNQMILEVLTSIDKRLKRLQAGTASPAHEVSLKEKMMQLLATKQPASTPATSPQPASLQPTTK
ncbi:MAG: hypothetical protein GXN99_00820 [Candidatus Nanohaloarchaeota archaeon]|nr:hypothetical protein [Candidatus Nanohaloarchaeota archaeon]